MRQSETVIPFPSQAKAVEVSRGELASWRRGTNMSRAGMLSLSGGFDAGIHFGEYIAKDMIAVRVSLESLTKKL